MADSAYDWECWIAPDGNFLYCSPSCERITGRSAAEFLANPQLFVEIVHSEDRPPVHQHLQEARQSYAPLSLTYRIVRKDGKIRWIEHICQAIFDERGAFRGRLGCNRDVTDRKNVEAALQESLRQQMQAESHLRESEDKLRVLVNAVPVTALLLDPEGRIQAINDNAARALRGTPAEMTGRIAYDYLPPDLAMARRNRLEQVLRTRCPVQFEDEHYGRRIENAVHPLLDAQGQVRLLAVFGRDITEQKQAEEVLRESEQRMQMALEVSRSFAFEWEPANDRVLRSKSCGPILGMSDGEAQHDIGQQFFQRIHPDDRERFMDTLGGLKPSADTYHTQYRVVCPDGATVVLEESARAIFDAGGRLCRLVGVTTDITQRKRAEQSEERLKALMNHNPCLVFLKDESGRYVYLNDAYRNQYVRSPDWYGKTDFDFWTRESAEAFRANDAAVLGSGQTAQYLEDSADLDGQRHCWLCYKFPFTDSQGNRYLGGIGIDATARVLAEEALHESQGRFRLLFDTMLQGVVYQDANGTIVSMNLAAEQILGKTSDELLGSTSAREEQHTVREDGTPFPGLEHPSMVALRTGQSVRGVVMGVYNPREKDYRWISIDAVPLFHEGENRPYQVYTIFDDITKRKRAEQKLRQSEERFRLASKAANDAVWDLDLIQGTVHWNEAYTALFGRPASENNLQWWIEHLHPADRDRAVSALNAALDSQELTLAFEYRFLRADGQWADVYDRAYIARDETGKPYRLVGAMQDLTERKRAEKEIARLNQDLQRRVAELQAVFDTVPIGLAIAEDARATCIRGNPATEQMLGLGTGAELSKGAPRPAAYRCFRAGRELSVPQLPMQRASRGETVAGEFMDVVREDGQKITLYSSAAPLFDEAGKPRGAVGAFMDVTQLKQTEERLRLLNETLEQQVAQRTAESNRRAAQLRTMVAELSQAEQRERRRLSQVLHDHLQQILVAARMKVQRLQRRASQDEALAQIADEADELIDQCISESRSLTVELSPPVLYDGGLAAALDWLARRVEEKNGLPVDVMADRSADSPDMDLRVFLFQAVRELLFNVVKHAQATRAQVLTVRREDGGLQIEVRDDGGGCELERFTSRASNGGGFGLFHVRERIELLGGTLRIESTPGIGTRVEISVPPGETSIAPVPAAATGRDPPSPTVTPRSQAGLRIVLADDHPVLRKGLADLLREQAGIEVVIEARDGQEALDLALEARPDVVVMDITMPGMDGIEATRRIKAELPRVRVIGLSMHEDVEMVKAMREAGASDYLRKDTTTDVLIAAVLGQRAPPASANRHA